MIEGSDMFKLFRYAIKDFHSAVDRIKCDRGCKRKRASSKEIMQKF